jgi:uncharacterized protein
MEQPHQSACLRVCFKESAIHGCGAFARTDIRAGTHLIEYVGEKIDKRESARRCELNNTYIFAVDDDFDLDGNVAWNPARFFNHSCAPNCDAEWMDGRIWIVANRFIQTGEELTYDYGYDLEDYADYPCSCGQPNCVGYIVAADLARFVRKRS